MYYVHYIHFWEAEFELWILCEIRVLTLLRQFRLFWICFWLKMTLKDVLRPLHPFLRSRVWIMNIMWNPCANIITSISPVLNMFLTENDIKRCITSITSIFEKPSLNYEYYVKISISPVLNMFLTENDIKRCITSITSIFEKPSLNYEYYVKSVC